MHGQPKVEHECNYTFASTDLSISDRATSTLGTLQMFAQNTSRYAYSLHMPDFCDGVSTGINKF